MLEQLQLIERDEQGVITITIWDEIQDFQRNEICREQTKERVRRYRERQRQRQETAAVSAPTLSAEGSSPVQSVPARTGTDTNAAGHETLRSCPTLRKTVWPHAAASCQRTD